MKIQVKTESKIKTNQYISISSYMKVYKESRLVLSFEKQFINEETKEVLASSSPIQVLITDSMVIVGDYSNSEKQPLKKEIEGLYSESSESEKFISKIIDEYVTLFI